MVKGKPKGATKNSNFTHMTRKQAGEQLLEVNSHIGGVEVSYSDGRPREDHTLKASLQ